MEHKGDARGCYHPRQPRVCAGLGRRSCVLFFVVLVHGRVLPLSSIVISPAAAAAVASVAITAVAVMVAMLPLLAICIALQQLLRCGHRRTFHNSLFVAH